MPNNYTGFVSEDGIFIKTGIQNTTNTTPLKNQTTEIQNTNADNVNANPLTTENVLQTQFEQITTNVQALEADQTDATWGLRSSQDENSDWIGLRQFLLYLATKFSPQSVFPFVELIPIFHTNPSTTLDNTDYPKRGAEISEDSDTKGYVQASKDNYYDAAIKSGLVNPEQFQRSSERTNAVNGATDLFNIDPFKEANSEKKRGLGYRIYQQLILSPKLETDAISKAGGVGFTSFEVRAGSQSQGGMTFIEMNLLDIQGNKFLDLNSPWSFIFDIRPGSQFGDFWFRYGWQIRVPDPNKIKDPQSTAKKFWNHPGWNIFGDGIRQKIIQLCASSNNLITLTQASTVNSMFSHDMDSDQQLHGLNNLQYDAAAGLTQNESTVFNPNTKFLTMEYYTKISLIKPELTMDERNGGLKVKLTFNAVGFLNFQCPLTAAHVTDNLLQARDTHTQSKDKIELYSVTLQELANAVYTDCLAYILNDQKKTVDRAIIDKMVNNKDNTINQRECELIVNGPYNGGENFIQARDIIIDHIPAVLRDQVSKTHSDDKESVALSLIGWFAKVLQENHCILMIPSGPIGNINAVFSVMTYQQIISKAPVKKIVALGGTSKIGKKSRVTTTQALTQVGDALTQITIQTGDETVFEDMIDDWDVFAYRFQGSLAERMQITTSDKPNAMTRMVQDLFQDTNLINGTLNVDSLSTKVSAQDKARNLFMLFSQMQAIEIDAIAHPWVDVLKFIFVKGLGIYDGQYLTSEVHHKLEGHKFSTTIIAMRMLPYKNVPAVATTQNSTQKVTKQYSDAPSVTEIMKEHNSPKTTVKNTSALKANNPTNIRIFEQGKDTSTADYGVPKITPSTYSSSSRLIDSKMNSNFFHEMFNSLEDGVYAGINNIVGLLLNMAPTTITKLVYKIQLEGIQDLAWLNWYKGDKVAFAKKVRLISTDLGIDPNWLMGVMWVESKVSPSIQNTVYKVQDGNATGLIQFVPETAGSLLIPGYNATSDAANDHPIGIAATATLKAMDGVTQLDYVKKYFLPYSGQMHSYADVYAVVFYPAMIGHLDNWVLGSQSGAGAIHAIAKSNPGISQGKTFVTVADFRNYTSRTNPYENYIKYVADQTVIGQNAEIDLNNDSIISSIVTGICWKECGYDQCIAAGLDYNFVNTMYSKFIGAPTAPNFGGFGL